MITTKSAEALLRLYDTSTGGFNPPIMLPTPHPLRQVLEKRMMKKMICVCIIYIYIYIYIYSRLSRLSRLIG